MLKLLTSKPIVSLLILVLIMLAFSIDSVPVSIMEARNFVTAREMITDGNWMLTTMNGEPRYEKPPLPSWITALFGWMFGIKNLIAFRFPTILFVGIIGVFTYLLSNRLVNNNIHSFINGLIIVTSFYIIGITLEAPWDIFTHGFMLVGIYHLFQVFKKDNEYGMNVLFAGFFIGCSILSKGPISLYALLLPFLIAYGFIFELKKKTSKILPLIGCILLALIVGGWWFLYVRVQDPLTFEAIATRETNNWHSYNTKPFYYYWSFFTQSGIWTIPAFIGLLYPYLKSRVSNLKAYQFSLLWTLFAVVLLSIIPEKKSRYLMPVLIPLAINTGFYIEYLIRQFKTMHNKKETIPVYFNFGLIALIALAFPVVLYVILGEKLDGLWILFGSLTIISLLIGVVLIVQLKKKNISNVLLLTVGFFIMTFSLGLPLVEPLIAVPNKSISALTRDDLDVYGWNTISPEMIWAYGEPIPALKNDNGTYNLPNVDTFGMLGINISPDDWKVLKAKFNVEKKETFDLNTVAPDSRRYNERLVNEFYILKRR